MDQNSDNMNKLLFWAPRLLAIAFILFLSLFAFDAFEGENSFIQKLGGFIIHLIPDFILILTLIFAWKHEWVGTVAFVLIALAYIIIFWGRFPMANYFWISGPLFLVGILFWISWLNRKKSEKKDKWNPLFGE